MRCSISLALCLLLGACSLTTHNTPNLTVVTTPLDYVPQMVSPGVISSPLFEGHASISPDENEMYYVIYNNDHSYSTIVVSRKVGGVWQQPEIAPFSGAYSDGSPALSPDGNSLFFSSNRPVGGEDVNQSHDIWVVSRESNGWGKPVHLKEINSESFDFSPSVDASGNLYFCSNRAGGFGDMDVYVSQFKDGRYESPRLLSENINSQYHEGNVGVSPAGDLLFVMVQHKPGDFGYDDIHVSVKSDGRWGYLKNIGGIVNTKTYDFSPKVSPDGRTLYFSSRLNASFFSPVQKYSYQSYADRLNSPLNGFGNIYKIPISDLQIK